MSQQGEDMMARLVKVKDWSRTPLGPLAGWSQSLRTTVSLCLASTFPISVAWGREFTQFYNDGYWPICGAKHPLSMGQDFRVCWATPWPVIGDAFARAVAGESSFLENQRMFLDRYGYDEETCFTFSCSPIRGESGSVSGLFNPVIETTETRSVFFNDMPTRMPSLSCEPYAEPVYSAIAMSIKPVGVKRPMAILILGVSPRLPFDDTYKGFCETVAHSVTTALGNARSYQQESERVRALAEVDAAKTAFFSNVSHGAHSPRRRTTQPGGAL